jgi:hypothetical protein
MSFFLLHERRGSFSYSTARTHLASLKGMSALTHYADYQCQQDDCPRSTLSATRHGPCKKIFEADCDHAITSQLAIVSSRKGDRPGSGRTDHAWLLWVTSWRLLRVGHEQPERLDGITR